MIRASLLSLIAGSALVAADQSWTIDVRGHVGASSPMTEVEGESVDGKMSLAWGIDAAFHRPLGNNDKLGLVLLGGLFRDVHNAEEGNTDLDYTVFGINLAGGVSWKLPEPWHLEGLVHARVGSGDLDGRSGGTSVSGDQGMSTAFGLSAGAYYTFPFRLMVGGALGYEFWQGESEVGGTDVEVEGHGVTFAAVAGYVF